MKITFTEDDINPEADETIIDPETGKPLDFDGEAEYTDLPRPEIIDGGEITAGPLPKVYVSALMFLSSTNASSTSTAAADRSPKASGNTRKKASCGNSAVLKNSYRSGIRPTGKKPSSMSLKSTASFLKICARRLREELDIFDLICHVAWDMPALTRRERADKVKKRNYFTKYGEKAREVLNALLDKICERGDRKYRRPRCSAAWSQ